MPTTHGPAPGLPPAPSLDRNRIAAAVELLDQVSPEPAYKSTGWYLRGLPELVETDRLPEPERGSDEWKAWNKVHRMPPGPERARLRSRSFPGMMNAAADQWGGYALEQETAA